MLELTVRLVVSLAIVVGLLLVLARLGGRRYRGSAGTLVQVVQRQPLSRTSALAVVTVGDRVLVLGTTEQQVSLLAELDPEELVTLVPDDDAEDGTTLPAVTTMSARRSAGGSHRAVSAPDRAPGPLAGPLAGSLLSPDTWRQALAASTRIGRRAS